MKVEVNLKKKIIIFLWLVLGYCGININHETLFKLHAEQGIDSVL